MKCVQNTDQAGRAAARRGWSPLHASISGRYNYTVNYYTPWTVPAAPCDPLLSALLVCAARLLVSRIGTFPVGPMDMWRTEAGEETSALLPQHLHHNLRWTLRSSQLDVDVGQASFLDQPPPPPPKTFSDGGAAWIP